MIQRGTNTLHILLQDANNKYEYFRSAFMVLRKRSHFQLLWLGVETLPLADNPETIDDDHDDSTRCDDAFTACQAIAKIPSKNTQHSLAMPSEPIKPQLRKKVSDKGYSHSL